MVDLKAPDKFLPVVAGPELFIALVAPVGVDLDLVCDVIEVELSRVRYETRIIKLSSLLNTFEKYHDLPQYPEEDRYNCYMTAGNDLRAIFRRGDALALLAISSVADLREEITTSANKPASRTAYIFRSLKHPDELATLRKVYGSAFYVVSAYAPRGSRVRVLADVFARSHGDMQSDQYRPSAEAVILRDEAEVYNPFGQNVRETFPQADIFVRADDKQLLEDELRRFVRIMFAHPFCTPTRIEYGMFHGRAAALRSADLSRQVGAVICNEEGDVLGVGCNDVPKSGGGLYWPDDKNDRRDCILGYDSSAVMKDDILRELFSRLKRGNWLNTTKSAMEIDDLLEEAFTRGDPPLLKSTQITNLLEFGRPVHAEMAALMDAAKLGTSVSGSTIYTTTFPCHICARHIVAAGIRRVVYIEPYPKSMVGKLYPDSITVDVPEVAMHVAFQPFTGIAPRSYARLFEMRKRKDERGRALQWKEESAEPRLQQFFPGYIYVESQIIASLRGELEELGLRRAKAGGKDNATTGLAGSADATS